MTTPTFQPSLIRLYALPRGLILEAEGAWVTTRPVFTLDALFSAADPMSLAVAEFAQGTPMIEQVDFDRLLAPIQSQEVWAAGVTYQRSRAARVQESQVAGGGNFYDLVYEAARPELFFKASPHRTVGPGGAVRIRADSKWNVPEPELTLAINAGGRIFGFTIGNDMSSRDIEGENPLYLPQAKVYAGCAALGPCLVISNTLPLPGTVIALGIRRAGKEVFSGETSLAALKRTLPSLVEWLHREDRFPCGCFLMTGTGIVPPDSFTLLRGDEIRITIEPVGTLFNFVA